MSMMVSFVLSFFPRDVLDEILNLIESVSEDFPSYFYQIAAIYKPPDKCIQTYSKLLRHFLFNLSYPSRDARIEMFHAEKQISGEEFLAQAVNPLYCQSNQIL